MNIRCLLGLHNWEKIAPIKPIKAENEFSHCNYLGHFALGECRRCNKRSLRECYGKWEWYWADELTEAEYMSKYHAGNI